MATGNPDPVEVWAPLFAYFGGQVGTKKFTDAQMLDPNFAILGGFCKLCDAPVEGSIEKHMKAHAVELRGWRKRRAADAAKRSVEGLKKGRRKKSEILEPEEDDE